VATEDDGNHHRSKLNWTDLLKETSSQSVEKH